MFAALILRRISRSRIWEYIKKDGLYDEAAIREPESITFYKSDVSRLEDDLKLRNDAEVTLLRLSRVFVKVKI